MTGFQPDREQIRVFVGVMFRYATPDTFVMPRAFTENTRKAWQPGLWPTPIIKADGLDNIIAAVFTLVEQAANAAEPVAVAVPVCTFRTADSAAEKNVADGLCIAVECDAAPLRAWEKLENLLGPTTLTAASGGLWLPPDGGDPEPKVHCYWRLQTPARGFAEHIRLKEARRGAARLVDGDASGVPISHPFRVPGSVHRKAGPVLTRLIRRGPYG